MNKITSDYIVIGSGVAGLFASLQLSKQGNVILITKGSLIENNSSKAQGGIAVAVSQDDSPENHFIDTMESGCGLNLDINVKILTESAPTILDDLLRLGVAFDRDINGHLKLGREGHHSKHRIIHAMGDSTGFVMVQTLLRHVRNNSNITIYEHTYVEDLIVDGERCKGVLCFQGDKHMVMHAGAVILATGGSGQLYDRTTNVVYSTGDGYAIAYRAGAELVDMEFIQFHPTALDTQDNPRKLISEAVRGEGAILIDEDNVPFMKDYHPWADLAPRDVVSRAIFTQIMKGKKVFLDATGIGNAFAKRFPQIYQFCVEQGVNPATHPIPVSPAAHFMMGGVKTDDGGRTSIQGLYACGEVACTGVHGANRLASNSLLEGLVFAKRVSETAVSEQHSTASHDYFNEINPRFSRESYQQKSIIFHPAIKNLQRHMWEHVGIIRSESGLQYMKSWLDDWYKKWSKTHVIMENMVITAMLIVESALLRKESRGAHYRQDYPYADNLWQKERLTWRMENEFNTVE